MARRRASMREGPLAELFKATEAAQRQAERAEGGAEHEPSEADAATVEHAAAALTDAGASAAHRALVFGGNFDRIFTS